MRNYLPFHWHIAEEPFHYLRLLNFLSAVTNPIVTELTSALFVGKYIILTFEMDIYLIGKPPTSLEASKPKRASKQKKVVETVNSDSDSEFGIPKKTTAPKGEDCLCITLQHMFCGKNLDFSTSLNLETGYLFYFQLCY
jgi:hypothetical protein